MSVTSGFFVVKVYSSQHDCTYSFRIILADSLWTILKSERGGSCYLLLFTGGLLG